MPVTVVNTNTYRSYYAVYDQPHILRVFKASGLWWVFFSVNYAGNIVAYRTSADNGLTWSSSQTFLIGIGYDNFDVTVRGNMIHALESEYNPKYRCGLLNADGSISWATDWQIIGLYPSTALPYVHGHILLDSNGYPVVCTTYQTLMSSTTYVAKSSTVGTWNTAWVTSSWQGNPGLWYDSPGTLVAMNSGQLYYIMHERDFYSKNSTTWGFLGDGSGNWNTAEKVCEASIENGTGYEGYWETVSLTYFSPNIHIFWSDYIHSAYTYHIVRSPGGNYTSPSLFTTNRYVQSMTNGSSVYAYYRNGNTIYRVGVAGLDVHGAIEVVTDSESVQQSPSVNNRQISNDVGIIWVTGSHEDYNVRFNADVLFLPQILFL